VQCRSDSPVGTANANFSPFHYFFEEIMKKFDRRTAANLDVARETVCRKLPNGGDHETRKRVAQALLRAAKSGLTNLGELESVGRRALREADRRSA
jgi:hypothetical protein